MNLPVFTDKPHRSSIKGDWILVGSLLGNGMCSIGVDPGVNYGVTLILGPTVYVHYGKLPKTTQTGGHGLDAYELIKTIYHEVAPDVYCPYKWAGAVVEGAAYWKPFGQVGLEEVRNGFFMSLSHSNFGLKVSILPPATIRKLAFGSGKTMATDIWPTMNQNGADSIGCALAALQEAR